MIERWRIEENPVAKKAKILPSALDLPVGHHTLGDGNGFHKIKEDVFEISPGRKQMGEEMELEVRTLESLVDVLNRNIAKQYKDLEKIRRGFWRSVIRDLGLEGKPEAEWLKFNSQMGIVFVERPTASKES